MSDFSASTDRSARRRKLRENAISDRQRQSVATLAAWTSALNQHLLAQWPTSPGSIIGFCWAVNNEPDMLPVLDHWRRTQPDSVVALPVVTGLARPLSFRTWHAGAAMVTDRYGIPTPAEGDFVQPEVLLIPLNAFDWQGYRIGYGGGFFDRTLASLRPRPLAIGVGFELGRVDNIWPEPHDERLDWIVTEAGCWKT